MILEALVGLNTALSLAILVLVGRIRQSQAAAEDGEPPRLTDEEFFEENLSSRLRRIQTAQFSVVRPVLKKGEIEHGNEKRSQI